MLTFHNQLTEEVQVFYTSDYCYKVRNIYYLPNICLFVQVVQDSQQNYSSSPIVNFERFIVMHSCFSPRSFQALERLNRYSSVLALDPPEVGELTKMIKK